MISDRILLASLGWLASVLCAGFVYAQESAPKTETPAKAGESAKLEIDDVKLLAQKAALPHLGGEIPFVLRESSWSGEIEPGKARLIQVQLFKRNDYHFWIAVPDRRAAVNLNLYNGKGEILETKEFRYDSPNVASLVASPTETGIYFLRLSLQTTVEVPQHWSVIYAYR